MFEMILGPNGTELSLPLSVPALNVVSVKLIYPFSMYLRPGSMQSSVA